MGVCDILPLIIRKRGNKMFGEKKNAILTTTLVIKVRKYKDQQPYFTLNSPPSYADENDAKEVVENLNKVERKNYQDIKDGWQTEFYSVPMTL